MENVVPPDLSPAPELVDELILRLGAGRVLAITGAGMSTPSGIPDYRGPDGVRRVTPMDLSEFVRSEEGRRRYWSRAAVGWTRFAAAAPSRGHHLVAALQDAGLLSGLITQNVDGLHQRAGSRHVIELHGSLGTVVCLACAAILSRAEVQGIIDHDNPGHVRAGAVAALRPDGDVDLPDHLERAFTTPRCPSCGEDRLKPDVVFFGESVPKERVARCFELVDDAASVLVLGSSVSVMSSYRFVRHAVRAGTPVSVVTRGRTRADDDGVLKLDTLVETALGTALPALGIDTGSLTPGAAPP